jgi:uncharacterized protein (TIGR03067 family)
MLARIVLPLMLLGAAGLCSADDKKDEKKKDQELIQGEWVVVESTIPAQIGKKLILKGDEWTSPMGVKFTFKLDQSKDPKQLDLTRGRVTFLAIYKVEDGKLTFCREKAERGIRPNAFKGDATNDLVVLKPATEPTSPSKKPAP